MVSDVQMGVEANDNPRLGQQPDPLEPPDDDTAVRMFMDGRMQLANVGQRGRVVLRPRARLDTYSDSGNDDLQRDDLYLNANAFYRWTRAETGLRANLSRESILSSEILDAEILDPDEIIGPPIDTDTGQLVMLDEHRNRTILAPYLEFSLSERSNIFAEATFLDIAYTGPELRGRSDFTDQRFALGLGRTIDDRTSAEARLIVSNYEADLTSNDTDTFGVEGTFRRTLSETWSFSLATGLQRSEFRFADQLGTVVENATTDYTLNLGFRKRTDLVSLNLDIQRLLTPNAVGFLAERNQIRFGYERRMSERLTGAAAFRYTQTGALDRPESGDRDFSRLDLNLEWAFTPTWGLRFGYSAVDQEFSDEERLDGNANLVSIGVVYRGLSRSEGS